MISAPNSPEDRPAMPEQPKSETELHDEIERLQEALRRLDRYVGM